MSMLLRRDRIIRFLLVLGLIVVLAGSQHAFPQTYEQAVSRVVRKTSAALDLSHDTEGGRKRDVFKGFSDAYVNSKTWPMVKWPDRVIPFVRKAAGPIEEEDITVTVTGTLDKLPRVERLLREYQGPISLLLILHPKDGDQNDQIIADIDSMCAGSPTCLRNLDVHVLLSRGNKQMNTWRNIARFYARTDWFVLLDIDMLPCTDFRSKFLNNPTVLTKMRTNQVGFVIPAFEYVKQDENRSIDDYPRDKKTLVKLVNEKKIATFHDYFEEGHGATNYSNWNLTKTTEPYWANFTEGYEPYVIMPRQGISWCEERFVGYGHNKIACTWSWFLDGIDYYVLPDDFVIHQDHPYVLKEKAFDVEYNRLIFKRWALEACILRLREESWSGTLESDHNKNMWTLCDKQDRFYNLTMTLLPDYVRTTEPDEEQF